MGQNISQMTVMGSKRAVIGSSAVIDVSDCIVVTIGNEHIIPQYQPDIDIDNELIQLTQMALMTGGTAVNLKGLKGKTIYLINIDNLIPEMYQMLVFKKDSVWVDGLARFNLKYEVDTPTENNATFNKDFTKCLVNVNSSESWDTIATYENIYYDKYTTEKLVDYSITSDEINNMTSDELDTLISQIETGTGVDIVITGTGANGGVLKADKVKAILEFMGGE